MPEVLSVCATQFGAVLDSIRAKRSEVVIEGDTVRCVPTAGAFITMNPGYLGRSELPEGLKSLFRPITVVSGCFGGPPTSLSLATRDFRCIADFCVLELSLHLYCR